MRSYNSEILFESGQDQQKLLDLLNREKEVWNFCSQLVFSNKPPLGLKTIHHLCYYTLKSKFSNTPSQLFIRVEKDISSTFRTIKSNKHSILKAPVKKNLSIRLDQRLFTLRKDSTIRLTTLENRITVKIKLYPKIIEMFAKYLSSDPLLFSKNNKLYLSFGFETPKPGIILNPLAVGIDLGIKNIAVTSEGVIYKDKQYLKERRKLRYLKRQLQSKGTKSARKHLKKLRKKEQNHSKNMCHNLSKRILEGSFGNVIVLEDLAKLKENTKRNKEFNNKHSQVPYYQIKQFLSYKAPLFGKKVETVSPMYTSQIDSRYGLKDGIRNRGRYIGKDGKILNADINAAINIARRSKLPISGTANSHAVFGQGIVNCPIVFKSCESDHQFYKPLPLGRGN